MSWTYQQHTGDLSHNGQTVATGYSGAGPGRNTPDQQNVPNVGPVPQGSYTITGPECIGAIPCPDCGGTVAHHHGPFVLRLHPDPTDQMFGRAGFLMHGDNLSHTASQGCIIMPPDIRHQVQSSGDNRLAVIR